MLARLLLYSRAMRRRTPLFRFHLLLLLAVGCGGGPPGGDAGTGGSAFEDHTEARLASVATFQALAQQSGRLATVKFTITAFGDDEQRGIVFYDGRFYRLHDEWYWFRLLGGQPMPGDDGVDPHQGLELSTLREIYAWAVVQSVLPLDLEFSDKRLYSRRFYREALEVFPKRYGLGSLIEIDADQDHPQARWAFQLEYSDRISHAELVTFFETLVAAVPEQIGSDLLWLVRSPKQEVLAQQMAQQQLPYGDRILRYSDLSRPGEVEVYNPGLTAGRVLIVNDGADLARANDESILVLPDIPDELPAATAVISAVPQTPLAHINLLAQNRGIPNLYLGDALVHPELQKLDASYSWAIVRAEAPDRMTLAPISGAEYARYKQLSTTTPVKLPPLDLQSVPYTIAITELPVSAMAAQRPLIGGKATGFVALLATPSVDTPDLPLALTVRPYLEHLAELRPLIEIMLVEDIFGTDARIRFLLLEGRAAFDQTHLEPSDQAAADSFVTARPVGDPLGDLVRDGGLKRVIRDKPIAASTLAQLTAALKERFASLSPEQGLRFRSSSTVEDVEGFNGAGLYDSNTGFVDPTGRPDKGERKKTFAWAIKKTWASYWAFAAFEERRRERIDHLSGAMALLVHPRFADSLELANGVFTLTVMPPGSELEAVMELNVQQGALSVTNPPGATHLPEVVRVTLAAGAGSPGVTRVRSSTVAQPGEEVLSDEQLVEIFGQARAVTDAWLAQANLGVAKVQQARSLTLDFEFRWMEAGWPARVSGPATSRRMVLKQARPLEPGLRHGFAAKVRQLPVPRDLLSRSRRVERRSCSADGLRFSLTEVLTDPAAKPDLGHAEVPFVAWIRIEVTADQTELGWQQGELFDLYHPHFTAVSHGGPACVPGSYCEVGVTIAAEGQPMAPTGFGLATDGSYRIERDGQVVSGALAGCSTEVLRSSPTDYLLSLLANRQASEDEGKK